MPLIFCIYFLKRNKSKDLKVFYVYTILSSISVIVVLTFRYIFKSYHSFLLFERFFIVTEFALISHFFIYNFIQLKLKKITRFLIIPLLLFSLYDYMTSINLDFTYYPLVMECLLFLLIILFFFYEKMKYITKFPIYQSPAFWIAVAFLIFSTGNFFLFLFTKILQLSLHNKLLYNDIYGLFTIFKNILLCTAVVVAKNLKIKEDLSKIKLDLEPDLFKPSIK